MDRAQPSAAVTAARGPDDVRASLLASSEADRRVEDWITSRLEGRPDRPTLETWERHLSVETPVRLPSGRPSRTAGTGPRGGWDRIRVERRGDVTVVHLIDSRLVSEGPLDELRRELRGLAAAGCSRIVLSLANLERVSSQFLEILAALDRHCSRSPGGRLKLCKPGPDVARIIELSGLDRRFVIVPDLAAALGGPWPEATKQVPVEILGELARRPAQPIDVESPVGPLPDEAPDLEICPPTATLLIRREARELGALPIPTGGLRIGREFPCEVRVRNQEVSRLHARVVHREDGFVLEDLGATNGTTLDGRVLRAEAAPLRSGATFLIGPYRFELADSASPIVEAILSEWSAEADRIEQEATYDASVAENLEDFGSSPSDGRSPLLRSEQVEGVLLLTPTVARLDDEETIDAIRDRLDGLLCGMGASPRVVIDLAPVVSLPGRAIGLILSLQLRLQRLGGGIRLAQASATVATAMEIVGLPTLIEVFATLDEAILSRWPD